MKNFNKTPKKIENVNDDGNKSVKPFFKKLFSIRQTKGSIPYFVPYFKILDNSL